MGSEMCIRDRCRAACCGGHPRPGHDELEWEAAASMLHGDGEGSRSTTAVPLYERLQRGIPTTPTPLPELEAAQDPAGRAHEVSEPGGRVQY